MRYQTVCPECGVRIHPLFSIDSKRSRLRSCPKCEVALQRISTDKQPWTTLIAILVMTPAIGATALADLGWEIGWGPIVFLLPVGGLLLTMVLNYAQYPFTNRFEVVHPECSRCGYDLFAVESKHCPECGAPIDENRAVNSRS